MKVIEPSFYIEDIINGQDIIQKIERAGRTCYKSEDKITNDSAKKFVQNILRSGHESVLEHVNISVRIICDRGVSHEIVRHRLASYSQESTRYCNYTNYKFGNELTFIRPYFWDENNEIDKLKYSEWVNVMSQIERSYMKLMELGAEPQQARSILPNSLKTEIVVTMNLREWRHFFKLRTAKQAHPQMTQIARPLLCKFKDLIPVVFDDILMD